MGWHGIPYKRSEVQDTKLGELVRSVDLPRPARLAADALLRLEAASREEIRQLQVELQKELKGEEEINKQISLLESIPGIGFFSAALLVLELWDVTRFSDAKHLATTSALSPEPTRPERRCGTGA